MFDRLLNIGVDISDTAEGANSILSQRLYYELVASFANGPNLL
jgi:hypothetical protein